MAKVIRLEDFDKEMYEPPLRAKRGITSRTVGMPIKMTMSRVTVPPGAKNQCHYHIQCDYAVHILKGRLKMFFGPLYQQQEALVEEGDFVFIPKGEIHGLMNLSNTEAAELVATFCGAGSFDKAQTIFVEPKDK